MTTGLVIVGCGGFGREVFSIVAAINRACGIVWTVEGFVDDGPSLADCARVQAIGSRILGPIDSLRHRKGVSAAVLAIGGPMLRSTVAGRLAESSVSYPSLVHPDATLGDAVIFGPGTVIAAGARLSTNIHLGEHVHVDQNVTVGHDSQVGDYSRLNPQACISGSVRIGAKVLIGANATVLPTVTVGSGATVGAHACVVHDVLEHSTVKGVPAR